MLKKFDDWLQENLFDPRPGDLAAGEEGSKKQITAQKAKALAGEGGWGSILNGKVVYSRDMRYRVWGSGAKGIYYAKPVSPMW